MNAIKFALAGAMMLLVCMLSMGTKAAVVSHDEGGLLTKYFRKYSEMRDRGELVIIDGECISACTLAIALLPPSKVCATPKGSFGFHSASFETVDSRTHVKIFQDAPEMTRIMFDLYPGYVRARLAKLGWDGSQPHRELIFLKGTTVVRRCMPWDFL